MKHAIFFILIMIASNTFATLTNGLVGHWSFSGNANDESGLGNHGVVEGAVLTTDRFDNSNSAYSFDGYDDRILITDEEIVSGNTMSVQAWFKTTSILGGNGQYTNPIVSKLWNGESYFIGGTLDSANKIEFAVTGGRVISDTELNDGLWHHAVGVYDGALSSDNVKLYIDGVLQSSADDNTYNIGSLNILAFGANVKWTGESYYPNDYFTGSIDDVMIWDRPLTQSEITQLYIPEPLSISLLAFGGLALRRRRINRA